MNKEQKKEQILELVREYTQKYLLKSNQYRQTDKIPYAGRVFDEEEVVNLVDSSLDFWLTAGRYCDQFETEFAEFIGSKYCLLVNSGSSANLLAFMALTSPLLNERQIKRGDEVITVACGFPTTISPIVNYGAIPVFVDITLPTCNINVDQLNEALTDKTKAIMIAHTLGNPFDINGVKKFCDEHNLWLIEDNCDALGSTYAYNGVNKMTGTIGDIGTSSFYPPHHMTMGEGGAVYTDNPLLNKIMLSMRDWGRDCICKSGQDNLCNNRFNRQYGELPVGYDHKYVYSHFGYNLKVTEMQAAIGVAQLKKIRGFIKSRRENFDYLYGKLKSLEDKLILPEAQEHSIPSWFGFLIIAKNPDDRKKIVEHLEKNNIQTRMLFASNVLMHPCFQQMKEEKVGFRVIGELENTNKVLTSAFWVGVAPTMDKNRLNFIIEKIHDFYG